MNRSQLRDNVKMLLNWDVFGTDTAFLDRLNRCIDLAYQRVGNDCPEALVPDEIRRPLPGTYVSGAGTASTSFIGTTLDPFVLEFAPSTVSTFQPRIDRTWDGVMCIEVTLPDGITFRYQCREFWNVIDGGVTRRYVSLDRPWGSPAAVNLRFRLYAGYLWMRDDIERIIIGQRFGSDGNPVIVQGLNAAIRHGEWSNLNDRQYGLPDQLRRENHYQHPSPNQAPTTAIVEIAGGWGPDPMGSFRYCFTYCWGYQSPEHKSPSGNFIPIFESAPSPISDVATVTNLGTTIAVSTPEIAWELNYGAPLSLRYGKSGWFKRIYRSRITTDTLPGHGTIEHPEVYQMLGDVEDTDTLFVDNGSNIPDYTIRLPEIHGYYGWSPWPLASTEQAYLYQLKVQRRVEKLLNDYDAPRVVPTCIDAITFYACAYLSQHDKSLETAQLYEDKAREIIASYRSRIANPTGIVQRESWDGAAEPRSGWPRARL